MTLSDVNRLHRHWEFSPPLRHLVAACAAALGVELPTPPDPSKHMTAEDAKRMLDATGGKISGVGGM